MRRTLAVVTVCALAAGACSSGKSSTTTTTAAPSETRSVNVDAKSDKFQGSFLAYFPNQVTVHPGDTVAFKDVWSGDPHTVTMGTLVEKGLTAQTAAAAASPNGPPAPEFAALPVFLPQGPGDINQNAAQPCYLDTSPPPADPTTPCTKAPQPAFNGRQSYYNSGFVDKDTTFSVKLADDIAPGTYHYYCNLHGPAMSGSIVVVAKPTAIPAQTDVDASAQTQLNDLVNKVLPDVQAATGGHIPFPGVTNAAGMLSQAAQTVEVDQFFPAIIKTRVGRTVSWTVLGPHTISFGAPATPDPLVAIAPDGGVHINPAEAAPIPAPTGTTVRPTPTTTGSSSSTKTTPTTIPKPTTVRGGSWNGTGQHSTGIIVSFPPGLTTYTLTFSKAGTYNYVCFVHPGMGGQVVVS